MPVKRWLERSRPLAGAPGVRCVNVPLDEWRQAALDVAAADGRLLALWVERNLHATVRATFVTSGAVLVVELQLPDSTSSYPGLADIFPCALRMQRAAADLCGVHAQNADSRPWLRHAAWPRDVFPLAPGTAAGFSAAPLAPDDYPFVRVAGDGVHEIAVGPVHAGIIEPGHFRFSVVGEKVLRLEERLGYVHKGIEHRFSELSLLDGHRLAARVSGDSAVAYSWAYCQALEGLSQSAVPARAKWLRAIALESERVANHLGDLGALGNDAGFAFGLAQFSRLKEQWLRELQDCF